MVISLSIFLFGLFFCHFNRARVKIYSGYAGIRFNGGVPPIPSLTLTAMSSEIAYFTGITWWPCQSSCHLLPSISWWPWSSDSSSFLPSISLCSSNWINLYFPLGGIKLETLDSKYVVLRPLSFDLVLVVVSPHLSPRPLTAKTAKSQMRPI